MRFIHVRLVPLRRTQISARIHSIVRPTVMNVTDPSTASERAYSSASRSRSSREAAQINPSRAPRFVMPAEWSTHARTITVWPDLSSVEDKELLRESRREVSAIANAIAKFEPVTMYTREKHVKLAQETVSTNVTVVGLEARQLWVRDTGPVIVKAYATGRTTGLCLNFNYWGAKLPQEGDELAATKMLSDMDLPVHVAPFHAEGGAIEVDGEGTLLATESSIINSNRNPDVDKAQLEHHFYDVFGVKKTIWIPGVKGLEMTDYHIDALARFVEPGTVMLSKPPIKAEKAVRKAYAEAKAILSRELDAEGRQLRIIEVAEPDLADVVGSEFGESVASYANYLVVNGGIIMPRFGVQPADDEAFELFTHLFPGREVVQVHINALPNTGGGIHCATQQIPA
ncbi:hypothetical protein BGZ63DRAFT_370696 [Mariannaea sp. PMI_226]|nr:hypothetical protein BGZ63DRAFT_370696 [Mariannaea sp. PMI_226]